MCLKKIINRFSKGRELEKIFKTIDSISAVERNDITRENGNMNADTPAGMMMKFASEISKLYVDEILKNKNKKVYYFVKNNLIHIHDKDYYATKSLTCVQYPLDNILEKGFSVSCSDNRPAKRIESACTLTCIAFECAQNEMHGGQAIPAFDFYLAPYVRKTFIEEIKNLEDILDKDFSSLYNTEIDDYIKEDISYKDFNDIDNVVKQFAINRTVKRVHQSMESFIHNMNTIHSRGGNQVVFSSINYGTDTSAEGRCIIREILNATYEGVGSGATALFPIQIWKKKRGVNFLPEDPNYDLYDFACKVTAKRFFPNFLNLDASFNQHEKWDANDPERYKYEVATMGCRTRVFDDRFGEKTTIGRGNLSFSTLNLPRIAIITSKGYNDRKTCIDKFMKMLDETLEVTAMQLIERYNFQKTAKVKQFPLLMSKLWMDGEKLKAEDTIEEVIKHGTLGIGFIGLAECLKCLTGFHHGESPTAQELGLKIIGHMRDKACEFSEKYNLNFSVLATPAESLCGKFLKQDRKDFGIIKGVTDKDYYTNSNHVPVWFHCSPQLKAKIEGPYHELTLGGHIFYIEMDGDATHNPEAIKDIVSLMDRNNMGYGSVNHTRNRCLDCGYENSIANLTQCPKCGSNKIDTIQRITGYIVGTTDRWNTSKLAELKDRVVHTKRYSTEQEKVD